MPWITRPRPVTYSFSIRSSFLFFFFFWFFGFYFLVSKFLIKGNFIFLLVLQGYKGHFTCILSDLTLNSNNRSDFANF
jgi:hypothetical protein